MTKQVLEAGFQTIIRTLLNQFGGGSPPRNNADGERKPCLAQHT